MKEELFAEFPPILTEVWESQIRNDLKGADYNKKLICKTNEGIDIKPYYRAEHLSDLKYLDTFPGDFPYTRGTFACNNWDIRQNITVQNYEAANKKALHFVSRGINSIGFDLTKKKKITYEQLVNLIKTLNPESLLLNFIIGGRAHLIADFLKAFIESGKFNHGNIRGSVDYDPLSEITFKGRFYEDEKKDFVQLGSLIDFAESHLPCYRVITIDGIKFSNSGASIVEELGFCLAMGSEYLSKLKDAGLPVKNITRHLQFNLGIGPNYFMEIAKFRVLRLLWAKIVEAYGIDNYELAKTYIHSETSRWDKTIYDPYTNILRTTTQSMSAILGGTNSLTVNPFDSIYNKPSEFSERIARNIQHIIKEESFFNKVVDPSAGSYYIENLTDLIAQKAWNIFLTIENSGGYIKAIKNGYVQSVIEKTVKQRYNNIATRTEVLLGTNRFPDLNETAGDKIVLSRIDNENIDTKKSSNIKTVKLRRGAEEFEKIRLQTETGRRIRPKVFMFTYGDLAVRRERSTFAGNFFACGGYEVIDNLGFSDVEEGINEAIASKSNIVVICSSDDQYKEIIPVIYKKLKNKAVIAVSGIPDCINELRELGIEHFVYKGINIIDELRKYHRLLKICND
jgi:methylmalonyl-CoA mutase